MKPPGACASELGVAGVAGAPAPTWPRSPVSVWLRRGAPCKVLWGGGWASPPGAVSNRKLLSFSFLLGFFSFKGAEVPRGLHQDKHGGFLLCSSLSSSLLSHRPLRPASPGLFCSSLSRSLLGGFLGFCLVWFVVTAGWGGLTVLLLCWAPWWTATHPTLLWR